MIIRNFTAFMIKTNVVGKDVAFVKNHEKRGGKLMVQPLWLYDQSVIQNALPKKLTAHYLWEILDVN